LGLLKGGSTPSIGGTYEEEIAPTFQSTKARIESERKTRNTLHVQLNAKIKNIPDDDASAGVALRMCQEVIEQTFGVIRCVVADQMQLYSESFFLLPMLRRLEGSMANMDLQEDDKRRYRARKNLLSDENTKSTGLVSDLDHCINAVDTFKVTCGGGQ